MAPVVTPARRRREEDSDDEEIDVSVDGQESVRSSTSKRARLDEDHGNELLPDSFRRSPRASRQSSLDSSGDERSEPPKHQPGSIVRVTLTNFVTYTKAEFQPGPNLNMIIGPNGTGKSTLVCAICLGLGWATSHLGRAKDLGEFVKHGSKRGQIEIELAADPKKHRENPVITTKITKEGNKAEYYLNGKKSNKKGVQELARSFSIQVDNLCQFLPQDRVVEFAALSPVDLLTQTQRAAAPEQMSIWHDELKKLRKDQKQKQSDQQRDVEILKNLEVRQRGQEADVERLRERTELQEHVAALKKWRPLARYNEVRKKYDEAKNRKGVASKELGQLRRRTAPNLEAVTAKKDYLAHIEKTILSRRNVLDKSEKHVAGVKKKLDDNEALIKQVAQQYEAEKQEIKETLQSIPRFKQEIAKLERAIQSPPEPFDGAAMNEQIREKSRQFRELSGRIESIKQEGTSLGEQVKQREAVVYQANREKEALRSQAGQQANKLRQASSDAAKVWDWIQNNRDKFEKDVYGPPIVECQLKNSRHAAAVESMISVADNLSFTVLTQNDHKLLLDHVNRMKLHDVNARVAPQQLDRSNPMGAEQLRQLGLEGWLIDLIDGPDAVLAMLCDNRNINQIGYTTGDISSAQFEELKKSSISAWATSRQSYLITRRRELGDKATSVRVNPLRQPRFYTDVPVDFQRDRELDERIGETQDQIQTLKEQIENLQTEIRSLTKDRKQVDDEKKEIENDKNARQTALSQYMGLSVKKDTMVQKFQDAQDRGNSSRVRQQEIIDRGHKHQLDKGQLALDYANGVDALRNLHLQLFEAEIIRNEAIADCEQLKAQHHDEQRQLDDLQVEVERLQVEVTNLREEGQNLQVELEALTQDDPFDQDVREQIIEHSWTPEQLETEVQSVEARLEMHEGGPHQSILREFEKRARQIEERRAKLSEFDAELEGLATKITEVREQWEPQLDELVGKISDAFAENFSRIQCAGEVAVHKDEDFELWAIQLKVKFREIEQLSVLDSHRQSGGERAVSTIFYLMALQSLARAPFRVVDEINQGMDPRNERLVHSRMVDIACAEHTSQYFLITPKLLNGLKYHPNMKVHCIASGEYMPTDHRELDFMALADKALELRARRNGVASAA